MPIQTQRRKVPSESPRSNRPLWIWAALACIVGLVIAILLMRGSGDYDFYKSGTNGVAPTAAGPEFGPLPAPGGDAPEVAADTGVDLESILDPLGNDDEPFIVDEPAAPPAPTSQPATPVPAMTTGATASGPRNALPKSIASQSPLPEYPRDAYRNQETGTVRVRATVDPQGNVVNTQLEVSSRSTSLDRAAVSAVQNWKFTPAYRDGKPIQSDVIVPVEFTL